LRNPEEAIRELFTDNVGSNGKSLLQKEKSGGNLYDLPGKLTGSCRPNVCILIYNPTLL
jgi:hypothetical protein